MPSRPSAAWERLGEMLVRRRLELDPRYRSRQTFSRERGPRLYHVFSDVELGKRSSYKASTLAEIEAAYQLEPGSIGRFLGGGDLEAPEVGGSKPATASSAEAPQIICVLATIGRNTATEVAEITVLADKVQAVVSVARAYQPYGRLHGEKLFPRDLAADQRLATAWNVLNLMGLDDEMQASIAAWNVVSTDAAASGERRAGGGRVRDDLEPADQNRT